MSVARQAQLEWQCQLEWCLMDNIMEWRKQRKEHKNAYRIWANKVMYTGMSKTVEYRGKNDIEQSLLSSIP